MSFSLEGKVAIITGGASGFGLATARRFAGAGARVVVASRRAELCRQAAAEIDGLGLGVDVTDEAQVQRMVQEAVAHMGRVDILINSAGTIARTPLPDTPLEEWEQVQATNLRGPFLCCKHVLPHMLAQGQGGAIVNIASYLGMHAGSGNTPAYGASKGGLIALTKALAVKYGPEQIRVNAICPAFVKTPLNAHIIDGAPDPAAKEREIAAPYPLRRIGRPDDVAYAALYLASDAASWITGITLLVDGGLTAR
jgi:NAD(P)-dependent dehydrogenase (short-subunit alcohol dehydrogenase family)